MFDKSDPQQAEQNSSVDTNKDALAKAFQDSPIPEIDKNYKKQSFKVALDAFSENNQKKTFSFFQGILAWPRLSHSKSLNNFSQNVRNIFMPSLNKKLLLGSAGTLCIGILGIMLVHKPQEISTVTTMKKNELSAYNTPPEARNKQDVSLTSSTETLMPSTGKKASHLPQPPSPQVNEVVAIKQKARPATTSGLNKEIASVDIALSSPVASERFIRSDQSKSKAADATITAAAIMGSNSRIAPHIIADNHYSPPPTSQYGDTFEKVARNTLKTVKDNPLSTFSIDVDTASYSFVRRQLNQGRLPRAASIRAEEMINYFDYNYPLPENKSIPFTTNIHVMPSPWATPDSGKALIHIGIKGYELQANKKPATNLVFLLDVSGSMNQPDKLPLVKQSLELLLSSLSPEDTISIVVYAGAAGQILPPTPVKEKTKILQAMQKLKAGGSTAGGQGIQLAYQLAEENFTPKAINRILLATDGDFNVGMRNTEDLKQLVENKRKKGIYLSVLGFGQGNYNDHLMQTLAQNGNGTAAYIDTLGEAQKVLVHEATASLFPIAQDVKIQVEFNPVTVDSYRLVGYETRLLNKEDFNNDKVDAGDIGAGHTVTAIYEITPAQKAEKRPYRYQQNNKPISNTTLDTTESAKQNVSEYGFVNIRYKLPAQTQSKLISQPILINSESSLSLKNEAIFASAVAGFSQKLKNDPQVEIDYNTIIQQAQSAKGHDEYGYRTEFIQLVRKAKIAIDK